VAVSVDVVDEGSGSRVAVLAAPVAGASAWAAGASLLLNLLLAITAVAIVAGRLATTAGGDPGSTQLSAVCLLGTDDQGQSLCVYSYAVAGCSMVVTLALALLMVSPRCLFAPAPKALAVVLPPPTPRSASSRIYQRRRAFS
jgi:hypothetical protein